MSTIGRIVASVAVILIAGWIGGFFDTAARLIGAEMAGKQFENSDSSYIISMYGMQLPAILKALSGLLALVVLALIWLKPIREKLKGDAPKALVVLLALGGMLSNPTDGHAFFAKTNKTEIVPIPPNSSAFWIPGFGANKDNQTQMNSEAYLNSPMDPKDPTKGGRVALKYFKVDHQILKDSSGNSVFSGYDYYTNTGVLILVDRSRFSREWVDATDRGTSSKKEGFPCQAKGDDTYPTGLNITVGVSVAAYVTEANAAKFLYTFGVKDSDTPAKLTGDPETDGPLIFQSIQYGRSLVNVMDDVGRKRIGGLFCAEIAKRTFVDANNSMTEILAQVKKDATTYFDGVGITLDFLEYLDAWIFDTDVQASLNRRFVAIQDEQSAKMLLPYADVIKTLAEAAAVRDFGAKTDGKLPTTFVGPAPAVAAPIINAPALRVPGPTPAPAK